VLRECYRVLRPGGLLRLTEFDVAQSNSPAHEEWNALASKALKKLRQCPSASSLHSWLCELEPMISATGFQDCSYMPHIVNYSYGVTIYENWMQDLNLLVRKYLPLMIQLNLITEIERQNLQKRF
jgi:ubiquinone/menaquinone biosynthesis C-methylase UbiE